MADKGYQGANEMLRCITPHKKPDKGSLTTRKERYIRKLSSDRIIVENFFGRKQSLLSITATKYKWSEEFYDHIAPMCISLTKVHIDKVPLRSSDGEWFNRYVNNLNTIGNERKRKRAEAHALYRARRNNRLRMGYRTIAPENVTGSNELNL